MFWQGLILWYDNYGLWPWQAKPRPKRGLGSVDFPTIILSVDNRPRGYKTFFVLNSVEHEILNVHTYKNVKKFGLFKAQLSYFSRSYMLKCQHMCWHFNIYERGKFHAQLS